MSQNDNALHFFLGSHTPTGFINEYNQFEDPQKLRRLFLIEGAPGTGKSTMIKRIAEEFSRYSTPYLFHCAFSPKSLDAVYFPSLGFAVLDTSYPHTITPIYPGYFESVISLYTCCNNDKLTRYRREIMSLSEHKKKSLSRCHRFLCAAGTINSDTYRSALEYTDREKAMRFSNRFFRKYLKQKPARKGRELRCFLSSFTKDGVLTYPENASKLCNELYIIDDDFGAVSRIILNRISSLATENGFDIISCRCPMSPSDKIEHLFIPDLSIGFITSNRIHPLKENIDGKTISFKRFTDSVISSKRDSFAFNRKSVLQIFSEAADSLSVAVRAHEQIENIYTSFTDFEYVDILTMKCIEEIKKSISQY